MPRTPLDPTHLKGGALDRWFRRSPDEIEAERQARDDERYDHFFNGARAQGHTAGGSTVRASATEEDALWVANGYGGYRRVGPGGEDPLAPPRVNGKDGTLPDNPAGPEAFELLEIGNPHNRRLKQEYIRKYGSWPKTPDGRDYDVSHLKAIADGGANTLDNIEPKHPDQHKAGHRDNGDYKRWAARQ